MAFAIADFERRAGPGREIAVAGAIDIDAGAHRLPPGLGLHQKRVDAALVVHDDTGAERMKQNVDLVMREQIVGRDLVGRRVISLRQDLAEDQMRRVQPAEPVKPIKQIGGDPPHHPVHLAINIGMQPAEIRDPGGRAHAAEKAVALDQKRAPPGACARDGGCDSRRAAAEDGNVILAVDRYMSRGFLDRLGGQVWLPDAPNGSSAVMLEG